MAGGRWLVAGGQQSKKKSGKSDLTQGAAAGAAGAANVFAAVAAAPALGQWKVALRARAEQPARVALLEARAVSAAPLRAPWRPHAARGTPRPPEPVNVVEVREADPAPGASPILWILLTSLAVSAAAAARHVVALYGRRWLMEE